MKSPYDPDWVRQHFDDFADGEWNRLTNSPSLEVSLHVHSIYLYKHIRPGMKVLEIGAGAGRFTQILASIGAKVTVVDISPVQVDLNRKYAAQHGFEFGVVRRMQLDMCNLEGIADESFDAVVCYGGPLSYVFDRRDQAMREMLRVLCSSGLILASVMSLWGTVHWALEGVLPIPAEENWLVIRTGDNYPENNKGSRHRFHFFRSKELREFIDTFGMTVRDMSASACLSLGWDEKLRTLRDDPTLWQELLKMEVEACRESGALDMRTHLIVVAQKHAKTVVIKSTADDQCVKSIG